MRDPNMARRAGRITAYLIPVAVLIIFLLRERSPFGNRNTSFAVNPKREITRIDLSDGTKRVYLEKKGEEWLVNGKYESRRAAVLSIIKILRDIQIKSPVSHEVYTNVITKENIIPVKVRVYQGGTLARTFLVYQTGSNVYGNIMKLREASKPFIVYVPGAETDIGIFFSTDELFWEPYTLFSLLPSEISKIEFINVSDSSSSFTISARGRNFMLSNAGRELHGWDTSRVIRYISYFTHVPFEAPASDMSSALRDSIEKADPVVRLSVVKKNGETNTLILWVRSYMENGTRRIDTDRLWAKIGSRDDLFIVRYMDIDPILKKRSYFFPG